MKIVMKVFCLRFLTLLISFCKCLFMKKAFFVYPSSMRVALAKGLAVTPSASLEVECLNTEQVTVAFSQEKLSRNKP